MNLTRAARSQLADPRREPASLLAIMFVVLAVLGVQVLCGIHPHEAGHHSAHLDGAAGHQVAPAVVETQAQVTEPGHGQHGGHHGGDGDHCSEDRTATVRYERTLSPFPDLAGVPHLAQQWLVPDLAHDAPRVPSGVAVAAAPSLHALGISRT
ncbi:hypothetical protein [Promicromonospora sp. NPDC023987]|uniref:hypothetical protein n=1 Tax=Promicromonospora sp. NPDC023987 TaxID=3155360 RepID=UPI0033F339B9